VECAAVWCIHGRIRDVLAQSRRVLVQVDDQLWKIASRRRELAHEQLVQARHIHWGLVDCFRHFEDEVVSWRLAKELECTSLVEYQKVRIFHEAEGSVVWNARRAESKGLVDGPVPEEMIRQDRRVFVKADDVCS